MWLYKSYREFVFEATGSYALKGTRPTIGTKGHVEITPNKINYHCLPAGSGPPVIVVKKGQLVHPPRLEGRHNQQLPSVPGGIRGWLLAGAQENGHYSHEKLEAWFMPCRVGTERTMTITVKPGTVLHFDVSEWPTLYDDEQIETVKILRRAANILQIAPDVFATVPSIANAYDSLESIWNNLELGKKDPKVELLEKQAKSLRTVFDDLRVRPRTMLNTKQQLQKLQNVRRINSKTLQWLLAQPGRNTAERAGAQQKINAPKRYETIDTLENRVLKAFSALTVSATKTMLDNSQENAPDKRFIRAHHFRARRTRAMLQERNVPEAQPTVRPNFTLRFDRRYNKIWRSWQELLRQNHATELDWMWQHRTLMEILGLRAAMIMHQKTCNPPDEGNVAHYPVMRLRDRLHKQGSYLMNHGIEAIYRIFHEQSGEDDFHHFRTVNADDDIPLGAIATVNVTIDSSKVNATLWWNAPEYCEKNTYSIGVAATPWQYKRGCDLAGDWDTNLHKWVDWIKS